jgi:RNA polymerase sigma factor (sigma-70 family)
MKAEDYRHRENMMRMQLVAERLRPLAKKRPAYREQLIHEYLPYVKRIVQHMATHLPAGVDVEGRMNVEGLGLIQAVDRFDPKRDNKFMTYAIFRITKQMSRISFINFEELGVSSQDEKQRMLNFLIHNEEDALPQTRLRELKSGLAQAIEQVPEKKRMVMSLYYLGERNMKVNDRLNRDTGDRRNGATGKGTGSDFGRFSKLWFFTSFQG